MHAIIEVHLFSRKEMPSMIFRMITLLMVPDHLNLSDIPDSTAGRGAPLPESGSIPAALSYLNRAAFMRLRAS